MIFLRHAVYALHTIQWNEIAKMLCEKCFYYFTKLLSNRLNCSAFLMFDLQLCSFVFRLSVASSYSCFYVCVLSDITKNTECWVQTLPLFASHFHIQTNSIAVFYKRCNEGYYSASASFRGEKWTVYCVVVGLILTTGKLTLSSLYFDSTSIRLSGGLNYVTLNQSRPELLCRQLRTQPVKWICH